MKYATLHFAFIYMAFINNLRWRNFGLCAKVSMYRAGASDRVFQRGFHCAVEGRFFIWQIAARSVEPYNLRARFVSVGARVRALLLKGEVPISDFHFPARARPPSVFIHEYARRGGGRYGKKRRKEKKEHEKGYRRVRGATSQQPTVRFRHGKAIGR